MPMNWTEKIVAPVAVVAIRQVGVVIDRMRTVPATSMWREVGTYTTYGPAVLALGAELLMPARTPVFVRSMTAPAVTIAADRLGDRLVDWIMAQRTAGTGGARSEAVKEAQRILAAARAQGPGRNIQINADQPITLDDKLIV